MCIYVQGSGTRVACTSIPVMETSSTPDLGSRTLNLDIQDLVYSKNQDPLVIKIVLPETGNPESHGLEIWTTPDLEI